MVIKDDVLIVEDSPVTSELLKSYLEKLNYKEIQICPNGKSAVETFKSLIRKKKEPIVLLDFSLPDLDSHTVFTQMAKIHPNLRVILTTASEKDVEGINELVRLGVFRCIEKPIEFDKIKKVFEVLELEQDFVKRENSQIELFKQATYEIQTQSQNQIEFLINSLKQISVNSAIQLVGQADDFVISHLKKLENENKIINLGEKKEMACNQCGSVKITQLFYCPACKSSDFKLGQLIEHYDCGNITEENSYKNDVCPNCHREIKALGVDYRLLQNHYLCNNCNEFFPDLSTEYQCLKCENRFKLQSCVWKSSSNYKLVNPF